MRSEHNSYPARFVHHSSRGFSFVETMLVVLVMVIVLGSVVRYVAVATQRSKVEQTRVDLTQEAREFVDEFERDIHQAGYPNCRMVTTAGAATNCPADYTQLTVAKNPALAIGLVYVSSTKIIFEGAMDGTGTYGVQFRDVFVHALEAFGL